MQRHCNTKRIGARFQKEEPGQPESSTYDLNFLSKCTSWQNFGASCLFLSSFGWGFFSPTAQLWLFHLRHQETEKEKWVTEDGRRTVVSVLLSCQHNEVPRYLLHSSHHYVWPAHPTIWLYSTFPLFRSDTIPLVTGGMFSSCYFFVPFNSWRWARNAG